MGSNCVAVERDGKASARRMQTRKERTMARAHVMAGKSRPLALEEPWNVHGLHHGQFCAGHNYFHYVRQFLLHSSQECT